jgi:hypothetical protein
VVWDPGNSILSVNVVARVNFWSSRSFEPGHPRRISKVVLGPILIDPDPVAWVGVTSFRVAKLVNELVILDYCKRSRHLLA